MNPIKLAFLPALVFVSFCFVPSFVVAADSEEVELLRKDIAQLRSENDALRRENQALRHLLAERPSSTTQVPAPPAATQANPNAPTPAAAASPAQPAGQEKAFWITNSSGVRHNSRCKYYKNSNGRACGPNEGRACKICGG